jgi:signal transduction histidine kinase
MPEDNDQVEVYSPVGELSFDDRVELGEHLNGAARIVRDVILRQASEGRRKRKGLELNDPIISTLEGVVSSIKSGEGMATHTEAISRLVANQEDRAGLIQNLLLTHDYDRLIDYVKARRLLEMHMLDCLSRGKLTPTEALAFMRIVQAETETITNHINSGAHDINDVTSMLNKVDYATQASDRDLAKKFRNTTPQDRELLRKIVYKLSKAVKKSKL